METLRGRLAFELTRTKAARCALLAAPAVLFTLRNLHASWKDLIGRVPDDAFFYLEIARHLRAGDGFTFDGVEPTTGFHPLWLAIVTAGLPGWPPLNGLRLLVMLHGAAVVSAVWALDVLLGRANVGAWRRGLVAAAAGVWAATAYGIGMESTLAAALALLVCALGLNPEAARGPATALGILLGLARVDLVPLLVGAGRRAGWALLGGLIGIALTCGLDLAVTGEAVSTSAALKGMGTIAERWTRFDAGAAWRYVPGPAVAGAGVLVAGLLVAARRGEHKGILPVPLAAGLAAAVIQLLASFVFNNLVGPWYFFPVTWLLLAAGTVASSGVPAGRILLGVLVVSCLRGVALPGPGLHTQVAAMAGEVNAATPEDARIVAEDFPGMLAWFSERTLLPADGLAAGPGYRAALSQGRAMEWWMARGATHYAVTRRRAGWLDERPLVDRIAPPFLPVPPSPVPLEGWTAVVSREDPESGRIFVLFEGPKP